jgi:hypothetical protein
MERLMRQLGLRGMVRGKIIKTTIAARMTLTHWIGLNGSLQQHVRTPYG